MAVAIIGMGIRFPGSADSVDNFWEMLSTGGNAWSPIPVDRFGGKDILSQGQPIKGAHFLKQDIASFDADAFHITREEAEMMDPQQRLLLEVSYEALENAGIPMESIAGTDTGVFVGKFTQDYDSLLSKEGANGRHRATGTGQAIMSNRLSYVFDLKGPSVTIDTACSASLVALHQARQSILTGEVDQAIVAGVNVMCQRDIMASLGQLGVLSPDGRSYPFDQRGNGYGRGEGCASLILKRLDAAQRDGDPIRAVIRGSGVNSDGRTTGLTFPSGEAQEMLMRKTYDDAGLSPSDTVLFEAHGTGTPVGDPIEARAIHKLFRKDQSTASPLFIGSIKSNIGHLEGASGLAGVAKAVLSLEKGFILPNYDFQQSNHHIPLDEWNMKIPTETQRWPAGAAKRVSINSFGYGGTNAHVIIDGAPDISSAPQDSLTHRSIDFIQNLFDRPSVPNKNIFILSSHGAISGRQLVQNMAEYVELHQKEDQDFMRDLAYTLSKRRSLLSYRLAVSASTPGELLAVLKASPHKMRKAPKNCAIGFVFNGMGAQWARMGVELFQTYPVFRECFSRADTYLRELGCRWNAVEEISKGMATTRIEDPQVSQVLCTILQMALVNLLWSWNIHPVAVVGHSGGEIPAAYAVGALTFKAALKVAFFRGHLMSTLAETDKDTGAMLAVGLSGDKVEQKYIPSIKSGKMNVACYNSPSNVTVSGDIQAISDLEALLTAKGIFTRRLRVNLAYHSHRVSPAADACRQALHDIHPRAERRARFYSSVHGKEIPNDELDTEYWVKNMVSPVKYSQAMTEMCRVGKGLTTLLEIGPHSTLSGPTKQILHSLGENVQTSKIPYASCLIRGTSAVVTMKAAARSLFVNGCAVDISQVNNEYIKQKPRTLTDLPSYPWNHTHSYWYESAATDSTTSCSCSAISGRSLLESTSSSSQPDTNSSERNTAAFDTEQHPKSQIIPLQDVESTLYPDTPHDENCERHLERVVWRDSLDLMDQRQAKQALASSDHDPRMSQMLHCLDRAATFYVQNVIETFTPDDVKEFRDHHRQLFQMLKEIQDNNPLVSSIPSRTDAEGITSMVSSAIACGPEGQMLCRVGENLPRILRQEVDPLSVMLEGNLLFDYYRSALGVSNCHKGLADIVDKFSQVNQNMSVLEIGAGTGASSLAILRALTNPDTGKLPLSRYDFTDVSPGFFEKARKVFEPWSTYMHYKVFNIEKDPAAQGFECGTYDAIVASDVIHATKNMDSTLRNLRKLLKPSGKLIVVDLTNTPLRWSMIFGTLPGWWLGADEGRTSGPTISESAWDDLFRKTSFSGLDICIRDFADPKEHLHSVMVSTNVSESSHAYPPCTILHGRQDLSLDPLLSCLRKQGFSDVSVTDCECDASLLAGRLCVFVSSLHDSSDIAKVSRMLDQAKGVLLVTKDAALPGMTPDAYFANAIVAALDKKDAERKILTLDMDSHSALFTEPSSQVVCNVLQRVFVAADLAGDYEFRERNGHIQVRRTLAADADAMSSSLASLDSTQQPTTGDGPTEHEFHAVYLSLTEELTEHLSSLGTPPTVIDRVQKCLRDVVKGGKLTRGRLPLQTAKSLRGAALTTTQARQLTIAGWIMEMKHGAYIMDDDIIDRSILRRGQRCRYLDPNIGLTAIVDSYVIRSCARHLLRVHFQDHPAYVDMLHLFDTTLLQASVGQLTDVHIAQTNFLGFQHFTTDTNEFIATYKGAKYTVYLPVAFTLHYLGLAPQVDMKLVENIADVLGVYFQAQDDYLDIFGDPAKTGKIGTDVEERKCSWIITNALARCSPEQRSMLVVAYSDMDVDKVKSILDSLGMQEVFHEYEDSVKDKVRTMIDELDGNDGLKGVFTSYLDIIFRRSV